MARASSPRPLRTRYGKASGPKLTAEDKRDLALAEEGLRQLQAHPESAISSEEVKRRFEAT